MNVRGDSMQPLFSDGNTIFINTADREPAAYKRIFVFRHNNNVSVKYIHSVPEGYLVSAANSFYDPYIAHPDDNDDFEIIGRVWSWNGVDL